MGRFFAGVISSLLLVTAAFLFWQSRATGGPQIGPPPAGEVPSLTAFDLAEPPAATERTREEKRFGRFDKDKNGAITRDEYFVSRRKAYAKLDTDGDGRLSFDEYAVKTLVKYATADRDRTGTLTPAEFLTTRVVRKTTATKCPPPGGVRPTSPAADVDSDDS